MFSSAVGRRDIGEKKKKFGDLESSKLSILEIVDASANEQGMNTVLLQTRLVLIYVYRS